MGRVRANLGHRDPRVQYRFPAFDRPSVSNGPLRPIPRPIRRGGSVSSAEVFGLASARITLTQLGYFIAAVRAIAESIRSPSRRSSAQ